MSIHPTVTVVLPAYNAAAWLGGAVESILNQSLRDMELLVMDDGSTDSTPQVLSSYADARLRVVRQANRGLVAVLNHGIELANGQYIARMDADDVAYPMRLAAQVEFLEAHPEVGICGTWFRVREAGKRVRRVRTPTHHEEIAAALFFRSAFGHPTIMFRRSFLQDTGLRYSARAAHAEDFEMWVRARAYTRLANVARYLLEYRLHPNQTSAEHLHMQSEAAAQIRLEQLHAMLPAASVEEKRIHLRACDGYVFATPDELLQARAWLDHLQEANLRAKLFTVRAFSDALSNAWAHCCHRASFSAREVLKIFFSRRYSHVGVETLRRQLGFASRLLAG